MRSAPTSLDSISPEQAAQMLFDRGVGLLSVRDEVGMSECLCRSLHGTGYRLRQLPDDFDAVRTALTGLWAATERTGRSQECRRFHPDASKRG